MLAVLAMAVPAIAWSDARLDYVGDKSGSDSAFSYLVHDGRVRVEAKASPERPMIFVPGEGAFILDTTRKTYVLLDRATVEKVNERFAEMVAQMRRQMAEMPADEQALMRQMMPEVMEPKDQPEYTVTRQGKEKMGGYDCRRVAVTSGGEPVSRACVASAKSLGMRRKDYDAVVDMMHEVSDIAAGFPMEVSRLITAQMHALDGVPVWIEGSDGPVTLESVSVEALDAELFAVGDDYSAQDLGLAKSE